MRNSESVYSLDLSLPEGKGYTNFTRSWEEEVIYFLLVDRFHDGKNRHLFKGENRSKGFGDELDLKKICGGTLKGVLQQLDYIHDLGCTALWISPVFENNSNSYHGYSIQNFLRIDERFGSKQDLIELIEEAHKRNMKVFLDCVINHSGDNWFYKESGEVLYDEGFEYEFGDWRKQPVPVELRNPDYYHKKGQIGNWDEFPESQEGDFFSLKKFNHTETEAGLGLQDILFRIHAYWIKETDCDGFRMDAAKHLGELPLARFSSRIKQYAKYLGKHEFFVFAEVPGGDDLLVPFTKSSYSKIEENRYNHVDSFLDFSLHFLLPKIIEGRVAPTKLIERFASLKHYLGESASGIPAMVTFLDNHDQIEGVFKARIAARLNNEQLVAALGLLFTLPGVPCLYYGTEQGFDGHGNHDALIREAMFDLEGNESVHNSNSFIYKEIQTLLRVRKENKSLLIGELKGIKIINDSGKKIVAFRRTYLDEEIIIAYNPNELESSEISIARKRVKGYKNSLKILYGSEGEFLSSSSSREEQIFTIELLPQQFLILK